MPIRSNSYIRFHHLKQSTYPDENGQFAIVRWDTDESINVEKEVIEIVKYLSENHTVGETARKFSLSVGNIKDLLNNLTTVGYISHVDNRQVPYKCKKIKPWLVHAERKWFQVFLNPFVLYPLFAFIISGLLIGFTHPKYYPSYKQFFWHSDLFVSYVVIFILEIAILFIHEGGHFIATKAVGGEAMMRLSTRYISIVAETESYHLAVVPRQLRYYVYFAGMFIDFIFISLSYWLLFLSDTKIINLSLPPGFFLMIALMEIQGIIWQYNAYLETDMYNFLSDFLKEENLKINTKKYIALKIHSIKSRLFLPLKKIILNAVIDKNAFEESLDFRLITRKEKKYFLIYGIILVTGIIFMTANFLFIRIPQQLVFIFGSLRNILSALSSQDLIGISKNITVFVLVSYPYFLLVYLHWRKKGHS